MQTQACKKVFLVEDFAPVRHRLIELLGEIDGEQVAGYHMHGEVVASTASATTSTSARRWRSRIPRSVRCPSKASRKSPATARRSSITCTVISRGKSPASGR